MDNKRDIKRVQEYYDSFLASEPGKHSSLAEFRARFDPIMSYLANIGRPHLKILDVGCGTGMAAEKLRKFGDVYGVDLSPKSIKELKENRRCDDACVSMAEKLPFKSNIFDVVVCTELIEHLLDPSAALAGMNYVLKPDGCLFLSTPNPWYYPGVRGIAGRVFTKIKGKKLGSGQIIENLISFSKLETTLKKLGFRIEEHYTVYFQRDFICQLLKIIFPNLGLYQICFAKK
ncbi:class I SAM-dependent methyltransferase [Chloroflexota bacterium]